jgi:lactoylglutathione lyase
MAKPIHMMIRVLDEARSVPFYQAALGFKIADRYAFDDFTWSISAVRARHSKSN